MHCRLLDWSEATTIRERIVKWHSLWAALEWHSVRGCTMEGRGLDTFLGASIRKTTLTLK